MVKFFLGLFEVVWKSLLTLVAIMILATGCSSGESAAEKAKKEVARQEQAEKDRIAGFHCLSSWNGSHRQTVNYITKNLRDPDSFQHIETKITPVKNGKHNLVMTYRAKNGFGGYANGAVIVEVDNESCSGKLIKSIQ